MTSEPLWHVSFTEEKKSSRWITELILTGKRFLYFPQYFVFDFHVPPHVMFDKIIKLSVSNAEAKSKHSTPAQQAVITFVSLCDECPGRLIVNITLWRLPTFQKSE